MTNTLNWNFAIGDRLSAPSKVMSGALDKVLNKLRANDKAITKVEQRQKALAGASAKSKSGLDSEAVSIGKATAALDRHAKALGAVADANGKLRDSRGRFVGTGLGGSKGGAGVFGGLGIPGLGALGGIVGAGFLAKQGFDAGLNLLVKGIQESSFKRNALSQMELLGDSTSGARTNYDWMMKLSDATPFDDKTVVGAVNRFRSSGFGLGETQALMLGISDAAGTSAENAAEMVNQFLQIKSVGKVTLDNLNTFLERTGGVLSRDDIFGGVAKRRGIALSQLDRENVSFDDFANAFMDAVQEKINRGSLLGTRSIKLGRETIEGQWEALRNNYDRLFRDIGVDPVVNMLDRLNKELMGAFGEDMKRGINSLFSDTFDALFSKYQGAGGFDRLKDDLRTLGERALTFAAALEKIVIAAAKAADLALKMGGGASNVWNSMFGDAGEQQLRAQAEVHRFARDTLGLPSWLFTDRRRASIEWLESRERLESDQRKGAPSSGSLDSIDYDWTGVPDPMPLAKGGIVRRPTYALIGEAGPEAVVPLSGGRGLGSPQITIVQHIASGGGDVARQVAEETRRALTEALESLALRAGVA